MRGGIGDPPSQDGVRGKRAALAMSIRPFSFRSADAARRDPQGGSLDPTIVDLTATAVAEPPPSSNWVLGSSAAMKRIAKSIERAAEVECTVLVSGETGTGKELWARLLHRSGPRRAKPFVPVMKIVEQRDAVTEELAIREIKNLG